MGKNSAETDRKAKIEEMRKAQQASERRRTMLVVGSAVAVMVVLVGVVVAVIRDSVADRDITAVGVPAASAQCDDPIEEATSGGNVHVGPGTDQPDKVRVEYATVPPTSGEHLPSPEFPARAFYTADDRPSMEALVHNLEHGYTVLWYAPDLPEAQLAELRKIGDLARDDENTNDKFIVSAWDASYGELPEGKTVALSHWGAEQGYRQLCGAVSGEVVQNFVADYPAADSPEPNAA